MIRSVILTVFLACIPEVILGATCDGSKQIALYNEWKCKPIYGLNKTCAVQYNCTNVFRQQKTKCFFQGALYNQNQKISDPGLVRNCYMECSCGKSNDKPKILCAAVGCVFYTMSIGNSCVPVYPKIDHCCPNELCGPFTSVAKCMLGNKTYYEGQRVPKHKCSTCLCTKKGIVCDRNKCFVELFNVDTIRNKCAPVYQSSSCCPVEWLCYDKTKDLIVQNGPNLPTKPPQPLCHYGNVTLKVGDFMVRRPSANEGYICSCKLPPLLTCGKYKIPDQ